MTKRLMTKRFMSTRLNCLVFACAVLLTFSAAMFVFGQTSSNLTNLRDQLRQRYDVVALRDGVGLVPHQRASDIRLIEIRNGGVAINGDAVTAREARERLGQDAELILRVTYLDAAAQRELARADSAAPGSQAGAGGGPNGGPNNGANQPEPTPPPTSPPQSPDRTQTHRGDLVRIGGSVNVGRDEVVDGDVVAIGGSAEIDGEVMREVTVVGGSLNLGPDAVVRGDVSVVGGTLTRSPTARTYGKVDNVAFGTQFPFNRRFAGAVPFRSPFSRVGGFLGTALRMTLLILSALVVVALGGRLVESIANRTAAEPLRSGLVGLLAEVLFLPLLIITIVVLAVSIVGIPLLLLVPFGMVLVMVLMLVGFAGVAYQVGRLVSNRFGIARGSYASVALGIVVVIGITLLARIISLLGGFVFGLVVAGSLAAVGYLVEYLAWTIGLGAVILTWFDNRRRGAPPVAGAPPTSSEAPAQ